MIIKTLPVSLLILSAFITTAVSQEAKLGATSVRLPTPTGYCQLTESNNVDGRLISLLRESIRPNQVLGQFANCTQLADWRSGKIANLDDVFYYSARESMTRTETQASENDVKEFCDFVRAEGDKLFPSAMSEPKRRMEQALEGLKLNEARLLGILKQEPWACYWGMLQSLQTPGGGSKTNLTISVITLLKNKLVTGVMVTRYVDANAIDQVLAKQTSVVSNARNVN